MANDSANTTLEAATIVFAVCSIESFSSNTNICTEFNDHNMSSDPNCVRNRSSTEGCYGRIMIEFVVVDFNIVKYAPRRIFDFEFFEIQPDEGSADLDIIERSADTGPMILSW